MRRIRLGLANINPTVGAFRTNTDLCIEAALNIAGERCTVGAFSEGVISGYPCEDLIQWRGFVEGQRRQLERFATETAKAAFPTVFVLGLTAACDGLLYNSAAVVCRGNILALVPKEKLPSYGIFYENRTYSRWLPGRVARSADVPMGDLILTFPFGTMAVEICEDLWVPDGPMRRRAASGAELAVNISASPWRSGMVESRRELISTRAADNQVAIVYVNQVGGQDALVFDGGGFVNQNGRMLLEAPRWRQGVTTWDLDLDHTSLLRKENTTWRVDCETYLNDYGPVSAISYPKGPGANEPGYRIKPPPGRSLFLPPSGAGKNARVEHFEDLLQAMKTGLADYFGKTGAFERIGIALSGGKDSALSLIVAWLFARERIGDENADALRDFIHCFSMPTRFNSAKTREISRTLCSELGVTLREISIEDAFEREKDATSGMCGEDADLEASTIMNIQARIRGMRMWNWANNAKALWVQTGNMSEKAVGYTTIGGDMMGAYSLLGNMPKTVVIELLGYLRDKYGFEGLRILLETKASAELAEQQEDEIDLMPFPILDMCFALFAGRKLMPGELYSALRNMWTDEELRQMRADYRTGMLKEWVRRFIRLFTGSIFKWVQMPQSVHLGSLDLDRERALQLPVVQAKEWLELDALDSLPD
jgi:NAD+ synthase (glutamine-hydrolysing)